MIKENQQLIAICHQIKKETNFFKNIKTYFKMMNNHHQIVTLLQTINLNLVK